VEILKEILRVVTSKSDVPKVFPELDEQADEEVRDSLTGQFLRGLLDDSFGTDDEAADLLYGTDKSDQRYRTLKSRTYERLLHSVLLLQVKQPEHSEYLTYYYRCTRNLICAQSLMRFASRKAGYHVALKTLAIAKKYQFTDVCLTLAALLRETAGFWGERKKFGAYNSMVENYFRILEAEYRSDALLDMFAMETSMTSRTRQHLIHNGNTIKQEIDDLRDRYGSHLLILNAYRHDINLANLTDDHNRMIVTCDGAIDYLSENPHLSQPARLGEFRLRKMMMLILVRRPQEAFHEADNVVGSFREAGYNWYIAVFFATTACMQSLEFDAAESYVTLATSHRKFPLLSDGQRETWTILGAYVHLAQRLGLYTPKDPTKFKHFRLSTYLNSVPEVSKNKKVVNVLILISHVYFLILDGDLDAAEKRIEYLKVYGSRYLKEKQFQRVRIFLRMLQAFPRNSFYADEVRASNEELFAQLQLTQSDHLPTLINEYIPFEVMYESLLQYLEEHEAELVA